MVLLDAVELLSELAACELFSGARLNIAHATGQPRCAGSTPEEPAWDLPGSDHSRSGRSSTHRTAPFVSQSPGIHLRDWGLAAQEVPSS